VTFATVGDLLRASQPLFAEQKAVTVDLGAVTSVDSAGLALLLEWLRRARSNGHAVTYAKLPDKLVAIAKLSGVEAILAAGSAPAS
jgi:phospholipid transport system transporter-binding protein